MLELTGLGTVLRGIGLLYWLLAIGAVALAIWKGKNWQRKTLWAGVAIAVFGFLPAKQIIEQAKHDAYAREAWTYFKKLCDEKSGEKIYKTYTGVKSVLVVKPLPPATEKDLFDQFWYGDPYSNATPWDKRGISEATTLTLDSRGPSGIQRGLEFVEIKNESGEGYTRITRPPSYDKRAGREGVQQPVSRFGVSWEDISTQQDRKYWVSGSRFRVIDLTNNSVVAERIGYFIEAGFGSKAGQRRPWLTSRGPNTTCPPVRGDYTDQQFIAKVFRQGGEK